MAQRQHARQHYWQPVGQSTPSILRGHHHLGMGVWSGIRCSHQCCNVFYGEVPGEEGAPSRLFDAIFPPKEDPVVDTILASGRDCRGCVCGRVVGAARLRDCRGDWDRTPCGVQGRPNGRSRGRSGDAGNSPLEVRDGDRFQDPRRHRPCDVHDSFDVYGERGMGAREGQGHRRIGAGNVQRREVLRRIQEGARRGGQHRASSAGGGEVARGRGRLFHAGSGDQAVGKPLFGARGELCRGRPKGRRPGALAVLAAQKVGLRRKRRAGVAEERVPRDAKASRHVQRARAVRSNATGGAGLPRADAVALFRRDAQRGDREQQLDRRGGHRRHRCK